MPFFLYLNSVPGGREAGAPGQVQDGAHQDAAAHLVPPEHIAAQATQPRLVCSLNVTEQTEYP